MRKNWAVLRAAFFNKRLFLIVFLFVFLQTSLFGTKAFCFKAETHENITERVIGETHMLERFGGTIKERRDLKEVLLKACNLPDEEESGPFFIGYIGHFYNPMEANRDDNARKRMIDHYDDAKAYFIGGDHVESIRKLGRALHYMQDMCCPVHLLGWYSWEHNRLDWDKDGIKRVHEIYEDGMDEMSGTFLGNIVNDRLNFRDAVRIKDVLDLYPQQAWQDYHNGQTKPTYKVFRDACEACCKVVYLFFRSLGIDL